MRTSLLVPALAVSVTLSASSAEAEWQRVLAGRVERIAASTAVIAAVGGHQVWLFRDDGTRLGLVSGRAGSSSTVPGADTGRVSADEILDRHEVSLLERDSDWAIELVDGERTLAQRRAAPPARPSMPIPVAAKPSLLTASESLVWIVAGRTAWRVDEAGRATRISLPLEPQALAAAEGALLASNREGLTLLTSSGTPARTLAAAGEKLAVSAGGNRLAWSSGGAIAWTRANVEESLLPGAKAIDVAYCGETLVALLANAIVTIPPDGGSAVALTPPLQARSWFCPAERSRPWLATGDQLAVSVDEGQHWTTVATPAGAVLTGAVATAHHVWLATDTGLYVSGAPPQAEAVMPRAPRAAKRKRGSSAGWLAWLPRVSLQAMARSTTGEHAVEVVALAQVPLEPRRLPVFRVALDDTVEPQTSTAPVRPHADVEPDDPDRDCLAPVRRKAVEVAMAEPERAESYVARAGHAAWLPELRVLVSRRYGRSESLDVPTSSTALSSPLGIDTVNDIRYEARATWDLGKLIFAGEELAAQNQALHMAELRRDIENTVNRLYFERRRLNHERRSGESWTQQVRVGEIEAELDALSGGAFASCVEPRAGRDGLARGARRQPSTKLSGATASTFKP